MKRSTKIIIIIIAILTLGAGVLFWIAIARQEPAPSGTTNEPAPVVIPDKLNDLDRENIIAVTELYLELLGRFDQDTNFENFNGAAAYATEALRNEMYKYRDALELQQTYPVPPIDVSTIATVTDVQIETDENNNKRVVAQVETLTTTKSSGLPIEESFKGSVSLISRANIWFVDDLDFEPDFIGFK